VGDCKGQDGASGGSGAAGPPGPPGPEFFDIFVDDFFTSEFTLPGELPIVIVSIDEPIIGPPDPRTGETGAIAYRVAIPDNYGASNDVTMRMFFYRTGDFGAGCMVFSLDAARLRDGSGVEQYGETRWVRIDLDGLVPIPNGEDTGLFLVIDLPINTAAGLDFPNDLQTRDFVAFEIQTFLYDPGFYQLLGVEFFEAAAGTATLEGATVFFSSEDVECFEGEDCNDNGIPDEIDIAEGTSQDCNGNGIPDECDIDSGYSEDCNHNGVPDDCDIADGTSEDCQPNGVPDECDLSLEQPATAFAMPAGLLFPLDGTYELVDFYGDGPTGSGPAQGTDQHNDDDSATVPLPFLFDLYGDSFNLTYVNNNGNVSFGSYFSTYTAEGFPITGYPMVAPFWADVDTGNPNNPVGDVWMKFLDGDDDGTDDTLVVTWDNVGYYDENGDLRNTFQLAISDGWNPVMGIGNNVCFAYETMQWTTGDASGGSGGFGGTPSTVGANAGNGTNYFLIGRFDHPGDDWDGPGGNADGVYWLDGQQICFTTSTETFNIPPVAANFPPGNSVIVSAVTGGVVDLELQFLSPELDQTTTVTHEVVVVDGPGEPAGLQIVHTPGNPAVADVDWVPTCDDVGTYDVVFTATDDFDPPGVTVVTLTIEVICGSQDCNGNDVPDECDISVEDGGYCEVEPCSSDCQPNGIPDECDIVSGASEDTNGNGIPDECEEEECICREDIMASCREFVGPIHGPDGMAAFDAWIAAYGGTLIDFESLPTGTDLRDQLPGLHFASISDVNGNPAGPFHVEVSGQYPNPAYGNTIVGSPCDGGCVDDGRVTYEVRFDEPQRWVGVQRLWLTENTVTEFYTGPNGDILLHRYEDMPCYTSWAPYFFGYVVDSGDPSAWITRTVMSGKALAPGESRQVGYSDNLRYGTAAFDEPPQYGAFVCFPRPEVDENCEFYCLGDGNGAGSAGGQELQCRVLCEPPTDLFYPVGDTTVTCTAEAREFAEDPWVMTDECMFAVSVISVPELCAGDFVGTYSIDGISGPINGTLLPDGTVMLAGGDLVFEGLVACDGTISLSDPQTGLTVEGRIDADGGCLGSGVYLDAGGAVVGTWSIEPAP
jgi:hypothetical protein